MSKRLQVILEDPEYREIQRVARSRRMSIAEWVRQALDLARRREPGAGVGKKLEVIRAAVRHDYPSADIDCMLAERWYAFLILVDSNVPMYLVGAPHPHKADAQRLLEDLISDRQRLVTDAEVLQEILHRYVAINRRDAIQPAFDALLGIADEVLAVDRATAERAKEIVMGRRQMSAREAIHLAVMEQHGIKRILSFDSGFDGFPGITRVS